MDGFTREGILQSLRTGLQEGKPILGVCAGIGLTAKCAEKAGVDLIFVNNTGRFRMAGRNGIIAKFSFGDANAVTVEMAGEILPVLKKTPAIAGVFAQDPFKRMDMVLEDLKRWGFSGVQNSPGMGMMKPAMAKNLEAGGIGFSKELELVERAGAMGLLTAPFCYDADQAERFARAGADILLINLGITAAKDDLISAMPLEECIEKMKRMIAPAKAVKPELLIMCHGGPLSTIEEVQRVYDAIPEMDGYLGGSSIERIPVERAIVETIHQFKAIDLA
jgi:predicted TIM-barrel enzyme